MTAVRIYVTDDIVDQGWRRDAACLGYSGIMDLSDAKKPTWEEIKMALAFCNSCPVWQQCFTHVERNPPAHPCVQGGLVFTEHEIRTAIEEVLPTEPINPCGTSKRYHEHLRRGEETCQPCRTAEAQARSTIRSRKYEERHIEDLRLI